MLLSKNNKSWFAKVDTLCKQYFLPDPLQLFQYPSSKESWKQRCKSQVISFWEIRLRNEANNLPSLHYFKSQFYSLTQPHLLWTSPDNNYEVKKAVTVGTMLSGRYVTDHRTRHWSKTNPNGLCHLCLATSKRDDCSTPIHIPLGSLEHLLLECQELEDARSNARLLWVKYTEDKPKIRELVSGVEHEEKWVPDMQLLLDPTVCPSVIIAAQQIGTGIYCHLLYLSRTWYHMLHTRRMKLLKLLNVV